MPRLAKAYLIIILTLGALGLILALRQWECGDPVRYAIYALAALLAACFKVRLPGMQGTISISFVVVLIGVAELSLPETLVMAAVVAVMQSVWKCKRRPQAVQVLFNSAVLVISAGAAYGLSHAVMGVMGRDDLIVEMAVAACVYFVANTVMVSGILGLLRHESV